VHGPDNQEVYVTFSPLFERIWLESVKDAKGNVIQEAPFPIWANFRQRALDIAAHGAGYLCLPGAGTGDRRPILSVSG
jgi:hypothetical protein